VRRHGEHAQAEDDDKRVSHRGAVRKLQVRREKLEERVRS
jgi:hypothetical protein